MSPDNNNQVRNINTVALKQYRIVRFIFWVTFVCSIASFTLLNSEIGIILFFITFVIAAISVFMPCPVCGKTVGFRRWGILFAVNVFGGWCIHCGVKLFSQSPNKSPQ
jgi:hypothetical protein